VLPGDGELAGGSTGARRRGREALTGGLAGTGAVVVTTLPSPQGPAAHEGVVVGADGVLARQAQLHRTARHPWVEHLGDAVVPVDLPWGRLVVVVGDDAVYPETFRLAALADAEVVALLFALQEAWELETGLSSVPREPRQGPPPPPRAGASLVADLPSDHAVGQGRSRLRVTPPRPVARAGRRSRGGRRPPRAGGQPVRLARHRSRRRPSVDPARGDRVPRSVDSRPPGRDLGPDFVVGAIF
jgi:hypothetical protein